MFKMLKRCVIGVCLFVVVFTFFPMGSSGNQVISGFKQTSAGVFANQQGQVTAAYNVTWDEKPPDIEPGDAMYDPQQGLSSGLYGTTAQLADRIKNSNLHSGFTREEMEKALNYVGQPPAAFTNGKMLSYTNFPEGAVDPFLGEDGIGVIRYTQGYQQSSGKREPWTSDTYHGGASFGVSSCGIITTANAISTLTRRWVNPMELFIVLGTSDTYGTELTPCPSGMGTGAFSYTALAWVCRQAGLQCSEGGFTLDKLDECLNAGGVCVKSLPGPPWNAGGGHYVMIYGMIDCTYTSRGHCYLVCNPTYRGEAANYGFPSKGYTFTEDHVFGHHPGSRIGTRDDALFIYPNPDLIPDGTDLSVGTQDQVADVGDAA